MKNKNFPIVAVVSFFRDVIVIALQQYDEKVGKYWVTKVDRNYVSVMESLLMLSFDTGVMPEILIEFSGDKEELFLGWQLESVFSVSLIDADALRYFPSRSRMQDIPDGVALARLYLAGVVSSKKLPALPLWFFRSFMRKMERRKGCDNCQQMFERISSFLEDLSDVEKNVKVLRDIPGMSLFDACLTAAECAMLDSDILGSKKVFLSYCGVVPRNRQCSGGVYPHRKGKGGNRHLHAVIDRVAIYRVFGSRFGKPRESQFWRDKAKEKTRVASEIRSSLINH